MKIEEIVETALLESKTVEYKGIIEEGTSREGKNLENGWLKTLVAFANTDGGIMYIGVEDKTHKVVALDQKNADYVVQLLHRKIREKIEPMIHYDIDSIVIKTADAPRFVIQIAVRKSKNLPVALHSDGLIGIYIRNFGRTDLATQEQIRDMILMSDYAPFDSMFTEKDFDKSEFSKLYAFAKARGIVFSEKELISKGIVSESGKVSRGALLFRDDCEDSRTKVVVSEWPGITKGSNIIKASEEYVGNLLETIEKVQKFVKNHSVNGYKKTDESRIEYFSYPSRSLTEGIVNAIGHRNYYIEGSQIEVNIFQDRLEITSPGALLGVRELHEEKNISSIIPRRRNNVICDILEICRYMEEKGSGFDMIEEDYAAYGEAYRPYVSSNASSFTLTLPDLTFAGGVISQSTELPEIYTNVALEGKNDHAILAICFGTCHTASEIAEKIGITPSTYFRKTVLSRLVRDGLLKEQSGKNARTYISNPDLVFVRR